MDQSNQDQNSTWDDQKIIAPTLQGRLRLNQVIAYLLQTQS